MHRFVSSTKAGSRNGRLQNSSKSAPKYSNHPKAAQSLREKGFKEPQHPKSSDGERHGADRSDAAHGSEVLRVGRSPAAVKHREGGNADPRPHRLSPAKAMAAQHAWFLLLHPLRWKALEFVSIHLD